MTDLHEGRGPKRDHAAMALAALAFLLFGAGIFTVGLGGPGWLEAALKWASLGAALLSGWRTSVQVRRWRALRNGGPASR